MWQELTDQTVCVVVGAALPRTVRIAEVTAIPVCSLSFLCIAISRPWSYVMLSRMGSATLSSLSVKGCSTLPVRAGLGCGRLMSISSRLVRPVIDAARGRSPDAEVLPLQACQCHKVFRLKLALVQ